MPDVRANGIRLYFEQHGSGDPILLIHGTSSSALIWGDAVDAASRLGQVIVYDRRGCTRSERPSPYDVTRVPVHADDAAALLDALHATPATVIGRSYGAEVALDLASRYPEYVRGLALLEPLVMGLDDDADRWSKELRDRVRAAASVGVERVAEVFIREVLGMWGELPGGLREMFTADGQAILAECNGGDFAMDAATLAAVRHPTLLVTASDSAEAFRRVIAVMAETMPNARVLRVAGGHFVSPSEPGVLAFVRETIGSQFGSRSTYGG